MPITNVIVSPYHFITKRIYKKKRPTASITYKPDSNVVDRQATIDAMKLKMEILFNTDSGEPPVKDTRRTETGNYCFRAQTTLKDLNNTIREYTGYDEKIDIVDKVENFCITDKSVYSGSRCGAARLAFVQDMPNCDGHVDITDLNTNTSFQMW